MVNELIQVFRESHKLIIEVLSKEYPLSKIAIFKRIREKFKVNITYQGVSKQINHLKKIGVLESEGRYFKLNVNWLIDKKSFFENTQKFYQTGGGRLEFPV